MKLKSLIINGFKSFADKTQINFQDGITAVVGPNGSGKSNVIEAIRWVLGEQSAKNLRGEKMQDVIFAGTSNRAPLNRAEVEIIFDNKDRYLPINEDEIVIARRIYRNGDSEFLVNGKQVRLKDITSLMMDTGLGRESFSIISQGRVESIFNSKPEERRIIIEEVAGVLKYKKEKQKAQQELFETADHLDRVADIVIELQKQREPLKKQSSIAKDYLEQKKDFDYYNLNRLVLEIDRDTGKKTEFESEMARVEDTISRNKKEIVSFEKLISTLHKKQEELNQLLDALQEESALLSGKKERYSGKKEVSQKEKDFQLQKVTEIKQQKEQNEKKLSGLKIELSQLREQIQEFSKERMTLEEEIAAVTGAQGIDKIQLSNSIEKLRQQIIDKMQEQTSLKNQLVYLAKEQQKQAASKDAFIKRTEKQRNLIFELEQQKQELTIAYEKKNSQFLKLKEQIVNSKDKLTNLQADLQQKKEQWYKALEIVQKAQAQHDSLKNIEDNFSGYYRGVKEILQKRNEFPGIIGSVAELLDVPSKIAYAIEIALGSQVQNIVVDDENAAKYGIDYLVKNRLGRVTFLPRNVVRQRKINEYQNSILADISGVLGTGNTLVKCAKDNQPILNYLLGSTVIVEDIDTAVNVSKKINHSLKIVSLKGDVINPGGSMTGGANKQQNSGLLEQKKQIKDLEIDLEKMNEKMKEMEVLGARTKKKHEQVEFEVQKITTSFELVEKEKTDTEAKLMSVKVQIKHEKDSLALQESDFKEEVVDKSLDGTHASIIKSQQELGQSIDRLKQKFEDKKKQLIQLDQQKEQSVQRNSDLKQRLAILTERLGSLEIRLNETKNQISHYTSEIKEATKVLSEINEKEKINLLRTDEINSQIMQINERQKELGKKLLDGKEKRASIHEELQEIEIKLTKVNKMQEVNFSEQREQSIKLSHVNGKLDQNLSELSQNYELTFEAAKIENKETDLNKVMQKLKLLKLGIQELGPVNIGSIDEYKRIDERFEFLSLQQNDLLEAKKQLQNSMQEMDNEVKVRFGNTFKSIADAFTEVFPQMFGGGKAALKLTDSTDLLTTGIEIMAQPPGKKLQKLSLLSGGEKALTALTLLFSILKVKPVPFSILDEAEAALDDANVDRYSNYLQNFHDQTQFIIITHRKGTMARADVLYGVTMQESGISRTVSVSLESMLDEGISEGG